VHDIMTRLNLAMKYFTYIEFLSRSGLVTAGDTQAPQSPILVRPISYQPPDAQPSALVDSMQIQI